MLANHSNIVIKNYDWKYDNWQAILWFDWQSWTSETAPATTSQTRSAPPSFARSPSPPPPPEMHCECRQLHPTTPQPTPPRPSLCHCCRAPSAASSALPACIAIAKKNSHTFFQPPSASLAARPLASSSVAAPALSGWLSVHRAEGSEEAGAAAAAAVVAEGGVGVWHEEEADVVVVVGAVNQDAIRCLMLLVSQSNSVQAGSRVSLHFESEWYQQTLLHKNEFKSDGFLRNLGGRKNLWVAVSSRKKSRKNQTKPWLEASLPRDERGEKARIKTQLNGTCPNIASRRWVTKS